MGSETSSFRAAWVIPVDQPPIHDGVVTVTDGIISAVGPKPAGSSRSKITDLGNVAIIPGLVNAHTHLEFSHLKQPLGQPGIEFTDWIRAVIANRLASNRSVNDKSARIRQGLLESFESGVWCVGEIATAPLIASHYACESVSPTDPMRKIDSVYKVVFHEQLGRSEPQFTEKLAEVEKFLELPADEHFRTGLSPHAPYSTHPDLVRRMCKRASSAHIPWPCIWRKPRQNANYWKRGRVPSS